MLEMAYSDRPRNEMAKTCYEFFDPFCRYINKDNRDVRPAVSVTLICRMISDKKQNQSVLFKYFSAV